MCWAPSLIQHGITSYYHWDFQISIS